MEPPPSIHLHIDRIILDGLPFTAADAAPIRAALEAELARLASENFFVGAADSFAVDALASTPIAFRPNPITFGHEVAASLGATFSHAFPVLPPTVAP